MMIALHPEISAQRNLELRRHAAAHRRARQAHVRREAPKTARPSPLEQLSIRRLNAGRRDQEALERLAGRDSAAVPVGDVLGAELNGRLVAAISLTSGELIADPFTPTAEVRSLLGLRATQLREAAGDRSHSTAVTLNRGMGAVQ